MIIFWPNAAAVYLEPVEVLAAHVSAEQAVLYYHVHQGHEKFGLAHH